MPRSFPLLLGVCVFGSLPAPAAEPEWVWARSAHFTVISDAGEKQARLVAREMEQIQAVFTSMLKRRVSVGKPFVVVAAKDEDTLRRLMPDLRERKGGKELAGVFLPGREKHWAVVRVDQPEPTHVIQHEYVHLLVRSASGGAPLWLNEGLAEFYGSAQIDGQDVRLGMLQPWHVRILREVPLLPIAKFFGVDHGSPEYEEGHRASIFYAQAAVLTHYLLLGDRGEHAARLQEFLKLIQEDVADDEAIQRAFGGAKKLEGELNAYVRRFSFYGMKAPAPFAESQITVRVLRPAEATALLADLMLHQGRPREARAYVEEALRLDPGPAWARLQRGTLLELEGRHEEAARALEEAVRLAPSDPLACYRFGIQGGGHAVDTKAREEALRKAVALTPGYAPPRGALARLLLDAGRSLEEAQNLAAEAVALDPGDASYRLTLLHLLTKLERRDEAQRVERGLLRVVRTDPGALAAVVSYHESRGALDEAEAVLKRTRHQSPRNLRAASMHAGFLERHGRVAEAEAVLREGLAVEPKTTGLLNHLAYLNAERGVKLEEALKLVDEALKRVPGDPAYQDTKGWVLFRLGRLREAEEWLRRALAQEEDPEIREHLGDVLETTGRLQEALECWRQALAHSRVSEKRRPALETKIEKAESTLKGTK